MVSLKSKYFYHVASERKNWNTFLEFDKPEEDIAFSDVDWCVRRDRFWCAVGFRYICVRLWMFRFIFSIPTVSRCSSLARVMLLSRQIVRNGVDGIQYRFSWSLFFIFKRFSLFVLPVTLQAFWWYLQSFCQQNIWQWNNTIIWIK